MMREELTHLEDSKIVSLFWERDESAIVHTAEKYGSRLRSLSYHITEDIQTAEECENDTYREAWDSIPPHKPMDYLYPFLARIIRHISLNCCRDRNRLKRRGHVCTLDAEMEQCIPAPDDCACRLDDMALAEVLNGFLGTLPPVKRQMFMRRYWYLDSVAVIAKRFGMTESNVKTTLFRLREKLRAHLEKEGYTV